jgi:hypothetical protein
MDLDARENDELAGNTSNLTLVNSDELTLYENDIDINSETSSEPGHARSESPESDTNNSARRRHATHTRSSKGFRTKMLSVLDYIQSRMKMSLATFLYALFYGDSELRAHPAAKRARSKLVNDPLFASIITNMMHPPRTASKGKRARKAHMTIAGISLRILKQALKTELDGFTESVYMHPSDIDSFSAEDWDNPTVDSLSKDALLKAPQLCDLLSSISTPEFRNGCSDQNSKVFFIYSGIELQASRLCTR